MSPLGLLPENIVQKAKPLLKKAYTSISDTYLYQNLRLIYFLRKTDSLRFLQEHPPGHFYSPIPDFNDILARWQVLFERDVSGYSDIELQEEAQLKLLESFSRYYNDLPFSATPSETGRYYYENPFFAYGDAITLNSVFRHYVPSRVIEIGSGFSSAAMLDINELFLQDKVHFTFIEPSPDERLLNLLTQEDKAKHTIWQKQVQDVPLDAFRNLGVNDILFVDSSHVMKVGSDVAHIIFNILPELRPGVIIHFHDIFWPFEYPKEWFLKGWCWNEIYLLRSFLQYNNIFEIVYFNSFMAKRHADVLREKMPLCLMNPREGMSSIWLKKVA